MGKVSTGGKFSAISAIDQQFLEPEPQNNQPFYSVLAKTATRAQIIRMKRRIYGIFAIWVSLISAHAERMENESVVFCSDLQPRSAQLLFKPDKIENVSRADGSQTFKEGLDYRIHPDGRMTLTDNSSIPVLTYYGKAIVKGTYGFADAKGRPFYSPGGTLKHKDYDIVVTYSYSEGSLDQMMQGAWHPSLTSALEKLKAKNPLNVTFFGDSITFGAQASSLAPGCHPFAPAYPMQVINSLKSTYGYSEIQYANPSVGGKTSAWGLEQIKQVLITKPDLVVLAFGMNDSSGKVPTQTYKSNIEGMMKALRAANPKVSIILVAEFSPNPEWPAANYPLRAKNRDALEQLHKQYENTALVDVGMVSRRIVEKKKFQDISGNNLNHPNDFLNAFYTDLVLKVLDGKRVAVGASKAPNKL